MKTKKPLLLLSLACLLCSCSVTISGGSSSAQKEETSSQGKAESSASSSSSESSSSESKGGEASPSSSSSSEQIEVDVDEEFPSAKAYANLSNSVSLPCLTFTFAEDVPYVSLSDFFVGFFGEMFGGFFSVDGETVTNKATMKTIVFDVSENAIKSEDLDQALNFSNSKIPNDVTNCFDDPLASFAKNSSRYTKGHAVSFDLSDYGAKLVSHDGKVYVPFAYVETLLMAGSGLGFRFAWNGSDFYYMSGIYSSASLTSYGKAAYSGAIAQQAVHSQSYADYVYGSLIFELQNFYGKFSELGIDDLDAKADELGLKTSLTSRIAKNQDEAIASLINQLFGDGGHTAFSHRGFSVSYNYLEDSELSRSILNCNERTYNLQLRRQQLTSKRGDLSQGLYLEGETAIIILDGFNIQSDGKAPTVTTAKTDTSSTFGFIYNCFEQIKASTENIANVVFDVTLNGGGAALALCQALSFMTDDAIEVNVSNPLTGSTYKEVAYYDNNLDGNATDKDSYAGQYVFYIMTSGFSFSCGNAFPCIAKEMGIAKIIGERSGGGDCVVASSVAADGTTWQMSGLAKLIHEDGSSFDNGAELDYVLDDGYFYDHAKLNTYLSSLGESK